MGLSRDVETFFIIYLCVWGCFPGGASGKKPTCQCRRCKRRGFDPWVGKIPWRRAWQSTPVFLHGESQGQRSLVGYSPWDHNESVTKRLSTMPVRGGRIT